MSSVMDYRIRPGIVLISICDEHILVATREAREFCTYVQQINAAAAYYWKLLEQGMAINDIVKKAAEHFGIPEIIVLINVNKFMDKLETAGYLIKED